MPIPAKSTPTIQPVAAKPSSVTAPRMNTADSATKSSP
jgi:hypothetical protein